MPSNYYDASHAANYWNARAYDNEEVTDSLQRDPKIVRLLSIFEEQINILASQGRPNIQVLLDSLEGSQLLSASEAMDLRARYSLEAVSTT